MENIGNEFEVNNYELHGYKIGTFVFNYREELDESGEKFVEIDVYKFSNPVVLYVKTYKAPYIENASAVEVCEALYEEFYLATEEA
ncbi:hypothetical protein [Peptostreptococcus faecalis]|uniref:hypothetical protein n=1 Tax=Peptostreptococcus faecalis TaxID=2045015 RepID=UPI000C7D376A|nr:hypothetical protein [Peptostreptococcus faecalis]